MIQAPLAVIACFYHAPLCGCTPRVLRLLRCAITHHNHTRSHSDVLSVACHPQVLTRLAAGGHRVLLFCTMTRVLDALEEYCGCCH